MASGTKTWERVVALGVPALLLSICVALMPLTSFWGGFIAGEVGLLCLVVESIVYRTKIKRLWYVVSVAVAPLLMVLLLLYAFWPHPLAVMVSVEGSGYSGSAGGIEWVPAYGRVELHFDNHTSSGYDDAEFKFSAAGGLQIMNMAAVSGPVNEVSLYPESNMPVRFTGFTTPKGSITPIVPLNRGPSMAYNITCKHIPANSTIGLIAAIAKINPLIGQKPGNLFADFMPPNYFHLEGSYVYNNKRISVDERLLDRTA